MTDKPILFSAPMVAALLDGRKTQTRRLFSPTKIKSSDVRPGDVIVSWPVGDDPFVRTSVTLRPQYKVGDRLWVKEAGWLYGQWEEIGLTKTGATRRRFNILNKSVRHQKPENIAWWPVNGMLAPAGYSWRTGMYMPRWASRLTLTVTDVRIERLHDIGTDDILAEGAPTDPDYHDTTQDGSSPPMILIGCAQWISPRGWYHQLWEKLHGKDSWDTNPYVCVVSFTVDHRNIDKNT